LACIVNHLNKWAYLHIPKTGGTSLTKLLLEQDGSEEVVTHGDLGNFGNVTEYFIFTIVRNPFTRIASAYQHNVRSNTTSNFKQFLERINPIDVWYFPQTYFLNHNQTQNRFVNFVGRYENYETDVRYILNKIKIKSADIPHENRNPIYDRHPQLNQQNYYKILYKDGWCKEWVLERYKNDFKFFNYELDI
jgi:hypothetical protein